MYCERFHQIGSSLDSHLGGQPVAALVFIHVVEESIEIHRPAAGGDPGHHSRSPWPLVAGVLLVVLVGAGVLVATGVVLWGALARRARRLLVRGGRDWRAGCGGRTR
jgi:hypothetical protein